MAKATLTREEVVRRGEEIYKRNIRSRVETGHRSRCVVDNVDSGGYEIDGGVLEATHRERRGVCSGLDRRSRPIS